MLTDHVSFNRVSGVCCKPAINAHAGLHNPRSQCFVGPHIPLITQVSQASQLIQLQQDAWLRCRSLFNPAVSRSSVRQLVSHVFGTDCLWVTLVLRPHTYYVRTKLHARHVHVQGASRVFQGSCLLAQQYGPHNCMVSAAWIGHLHLSRALQQPTLLPHNQPDGTHEPHDLRQHGCCSTQGPWALDASPYSSHSTVMSREFNRTLRPMMQQREEAALSCVSAPP